MEAFRKLSSPKDMAQFTELIPGLPEEIALECFTRLPYTSHRVAAQVCRRWGSFFRARSSTTAESKPDSPTKQLAWFKRSLTWERIAPVPKYPDGLPLFCQVTSSEGKLVVMGGWDPESYDPVKDVFVYDFTTRRWKQGRDMPSKRSFFAAGELEGRIFVAGGHDDSKNALSTAWVYDVRRDEWSELTRMSDERDECQGVVIGSEFWVVSGYGTESQGGFVKSAESLDLETGRWNRVDEAWGTNQCPRSCVGVGKDGKLFSWAESDTAVGVGACAVDLGDWTLLTGSAYQGAPQGFFWWRERKDKMGNWRE
ncbi:F-box/kelch-repeat protein [Vitis vinifera]|uniref:F-box/kelch-repeat protein n=1 Tax=Vitis vinifera TaxID=29760 RepID=A0A438JLE8_VITVI|nr:F-box/kelch-repeat protein [Vitis vinifera]